MTSFVFNLSQFSFKRHDWENHLKVDFFDTRCAVLTGLNAGGKTLVMKSLERFCAAVINPDTRKSRKLDGLVKDAGIESIKVRFEYEFLNSKGKSWWGDVSQIPWIRIDDDDPYNKDSMAEFLNIETDDWDPKLTELTGSVVVEYELESNLDRGRNNPTTTIRRRDGINLSITAFLLGEGGHSKRENDCLVWDEWGMWARESSSGLRSFGPREGDADAWKSEVRELTGLNFMEGHEPFSSYADENYDYDDPDRMIRFDANLPSLHGISEAYSLTGETLEEFQNYHTLDEWDEYLNALIGEHFKEIWGDRLPKGKRHRPDLVSNTYEQWKGGGDPEFGEASEEEITRVISAFTDLMELTDDEFPLEDQEHFMSLSAMLYAQIQLLGTGDTFLEWNAPDAYHEFIASGHDPESAPVPIKLDESSPPATKRYAIEKDPEIGTFLAIKSFLDDLGDIDVPSSGQMRNIPILSALSVMEPGSTVMIDEPELSLHINWQERLISTLTSSLPHLQFILASHSPHVIINHTEAIYEVPPRDEV